VHYSVPDYDAVMIGVAVRVQVGCACGRSVPINALAARAVCPTCTKPVSVELARLVPEMVAADAELGKTRSVALLGTHAQLDSVREDPSCASCGTPVPDEAASFAARGFTMCPGCGARIAVRPPPPELAPLLRGASLIIGEDVDQIETGVASKAPNAAQPIELRCTSCHAPLAVDGTRRTVRCAYCSTDLFLPDDLWLRLHAAAQVRPFFLCWASRAAVAAATTRVFEWRQLRDAVLGPDGNLYCAGKDEHEDVPAVWCMAPDLSVRWTRAVELDGKVQLALDSRGLIAWQPGKHSALVLSIHDGSPICTLGGEEPIGAKVHHLNLDRGNQLCVDPDGTLLALIGTNLVRFAADGTGIETWPPRAGAFGAKHDKVAPLYDASRSLRFPNYVSLDQVRDRPHTLSESARLHVARDGGVFVQRGDTLAHLDRAGAVVYKLVLPNIADDVATNRIGTDAAGNCYAVCTRPGASPHEHVLIRVSPDGKRVDLLATDHAHGGPLASTRTCLAVAPDGTCYLLDDSMRVRIVGPDGVARHVSQAARDEDERIMRERAKRA
jgi:DNA-directed RNA polymerase subunit RPC12/RpoP